MRKSLVSVWASLAYLLLAACSTSGPVSTPPAPTVTLSPMPPIPTSAAELLPPLVPITLANAKDVRLLKTLPIPEFAVSSLSQCSVDFSPDGKMLAGVCYKSTSPVWDVSSGRLLFSLMKSPSHVVAVSFSPAERGKTM